MKLSSNNTNEFKPIDLTITFESADELKDFYNRMNIGCESLQRALSGIDETPLQHSSSIPMSLWQWTRDTLKQLGEL